MRRPTIVSFGSLLFVVLSSSALHAEGPIVKPLPVAAALPKAVSPPLPVAKKLDVVNKAVKLLGVAALTGPVPPAQMKVTPMAPVHEGGAKITYARPVTFVGPASPFPDGAYMLDYGPNVKNELKMEMPTENGKLYLLDCKLTQFFGSSPLIVNMKRGDAAQALNPEDGHYLYTFKSDKAVQSFTLWTEHSATFYGCELTKLN